MSEYPPHDNGSSNEHHEVSPTLPEQRFDEFYESINTHITHLAALQKDQKELTQNESLDDASLHRAREIQHTIQEITEQLRQEWEDFFIAIGTHSIQLELLNNDNDPYWLEVANQVRPVPGLIAGDKLPQETRDYLREQFEQLSPKLQLRTVELDFDSYRGVRLYPAQIIGAKFSDETTQLLIDRMTFNFFERPDNIDEIFDIYDMINGDPSEDEDGDNLIMEGDEQKAAVTVLEYGMLPTNANYYKQVIVLVDMFTNTNYDPEYMKDQSMIDALPTIEQVGQLSDAAIDDIEERLMIQGVIGTDTMSPDDAVLSSNWSSLDDLELEISGLEEQFDIRKQLEWLDSQDKHWTKFLEQLRDLNTTGDQWQKLLKALSERAKQSLAGQESSLTDQINANVDLRKQIEAIYTDENGNEQPKSMWSKKHLEDYRALNTAYYILFEGIQKMRSMDKPPVVQPPSELSTLSEQEASDDLMKMFADMRLDIQKGE